VFVAVDSRSGQQVAVKKMKLDDESTELIVSEIHMMKSSNHPNIIGYIDAFMKNNNLWVVMVRSLLSPPLPQTKLISFFA